MRVYENWSATMFKDVREVRPKNFILGVMLFGAMIYALTLHTLVLQGWPNELNHFER